MEFKNTVMTTLYVRQQRDTDVKNSLLDLAGEGEGGMIWQNSIETCILSDVKSDRHTRFDAWDRVLRAGVLG